VDTLIELGFTDGAAIADALTQTNGAVEPALELLWATGGGAVAAEEKKEQPVAAAAVRDDEQRAQHDLFALQNHQQQQQQQQQKQPPLAVPVVVDDDEDYDDDDDMMDDDDDGAVEYRVDTADGCAYTKSEFMAEYGGLDQWHASVILGAASGTAAAAAGGDETDRHTSAGGGGDGGGERDWDKLAAAGLDPLRAPKPKPKQKQAAAPHGRQSHKQQQGDAAQRDRRSGATHSASSRADGAAHSSSSTAAPSALAAAGRGAADVGVEGVAQLVEMGFPRARALAALEQARGDSGAAMELLLAELC
jgi:hypothetical protein